MKYTNSMKINGELAMRFASKKAQKLYNGTDPFVVYEYEVDDQKLYAYDGGLGSAEGLTFDELQKELEDLQDEMEEGDDVL